MTSNQTIFSLPAGSLTAQSTIIQIQKARAAMENAMPIRMSGAISSTGVTIAKIMSAPLAPGNPVCQRHLVGALSPRHLTRKAGTWTIVWVIYRMMCSPHPRKALVILLVIMAYVGTGAALLAGEKVAAKAPAPVIWTLNNVVSVGGLKPRVFGTPKVVDATAGGPALQFNGQNDGLIFPVNPIAYWAKFTIEVLLLPETDGPAAQRFMHIQDGRGSRGMMETRIIDGKSWTLDTFLLCGESSRTLRDLTKLHPTGKWAWVALVYDGNEMSQYVNGVNELKGEVAFLPMLSGRMSLGVRLNRVFWFKGNIKEVRFIPAALSPEALQRVPEK